MGEWTQVALDTVIQLQRGHDLPSDLRQSGDVPVIGSFGVTGTHDVARYAGPGVAIGRSGAAIGQATWVPGPFWPLNTCLFVTDFRGNDPRWVYRLLDLTDFAAFNSGSAQPSLNRNFLRSIPVMRPPLEEQRAIAGVLGALDEKIAANQRVTDGAERLSRALWARATTDGPVVPLSSLARFVNGRAFTKDATGSGRVVIRIAELNSGIGPSTVYNDLTVGEDNLARPGDLLFAWSGSLTVARWFRDEAIINQHIFKVVPDQGWKLPLVHQALLVALDEFKAIAADKATTMGHIQRKHLDELVAVPASGERHAVAVELTALWDLGLAVERENLVLARTRDELLPSLMSGKLRVKDAERAAEAVL